MLFRYGVGVGGGVGITKSWPCIFPYFKILTITIMSLGYFLWCFLFFILCGGRGGGHLPNPGTLMFNLFSLIGLAPQHTDLFICILF